ncbi:MAG: amidohydrolase family protein, partial [Eggerthellaceae bacterium]
MDGHIHAPGDWVTKLYDIYSATRPPSTSVKIISDFVAAHPEREAYTGNPFMVNAFQLEDGSNPGPNKKLLDEICPDKPILLLDVSHHPPGSTARRSRWRTSRATRPTRSAASSRGTRTASPLDISSTAPPPKCPPVVSEHTDEEYEQAIAKYQEDASRFGLTGITNLSAVDARFFSELEKAGELNLRMRILPTIIPGTDPSEAVKTVKGLARYDSEMISTGTAKMLSDGVTEGGSAVMLEPYNEAAGKGSDWYGESE